jgi:hypothetical protein
MDDKILEYQYVSQQDSKTINEEKKKKIERFKYLNNYVKENKQVRYSNSKYFSRKYFIM